MDSQLELLKLILPSEISEHFDLVSIHYSTEADGRNVAHLHLDEIDQIENEQESVTPNGFYNEQIVQDYPIKDKKVIPHIRRRRWKTASGKTVSNRWEFKARGTRMSKDFAGR